MANAITIPSFLINGEIFPIIPNSLKVIRGKGTVEVKAQSLGSVSEPVFEINQEEAIGHITGEVYPTEDAVNKIQNYQDLGPTLDIQFSDPLTQILRTMAPAVLSNDPNLELGADQSITVEFKGAPIV